MTSKEDAPAVDVPLFPWSPRRPCSRADESARARAELRKATAPPRHTPHTPSRGRGGSYARSRDTAVGFVARLEDQK